MSTKKGQVKYKKAPQAPRRFKSSYMFFSTEKHKSIRQELIEKGETDKLSTTEVAKLVSQAWKDLSEDEKEEWEELARKDKARYEMEKSYYKGPWKVPAKRRSPKHPNAPKRPMSAFLSFSNSKRAHVKEKNPNIGNAEVSRILAQMWKDASSDERKEHVDKEFKLRQEYKTAIAEWRKNSEMEIQAVRKEREDQAMKAVLEGKVAENAQHSAGGGYSISNNRGGAEAAGLQDGDSASYPRQDARDPRTDHYGNRHPQADGQYYNHHLSGQSASSYMPVVPPSSGTGNGGGVLGTPESSSPLPPPYYPPPHFYNQQHQPLFAFFQSSYYHPPTHGNGYPPPPAANPADDDEYTKVIRVNNKNHPDPAASGGETPASGNGTQDDHYGAASNGGGGPYGESSSSYASMYPHQHAGEGYDYQHFYQQQHHPAYAAPAGFNEYHAHQLSTVSSAGAYDSAHFPAPAYYTAGSSAAAPYHSGMAQP